MRLFLRYCLRFRSLLIIYSIFIIALILKEECSQIERFWCNMSFIGNSVVSLKDIVSPTQMLRFSELKIYYDEMAIKLMIIS